MINIKVITLILLSFVLGTCEYVVIGILPNIAQDLNVSITQAGLLISVFAVMYSIGAPILTASVSRFPRYKTVIVLMFLFIIGNIGCMLVQDYSSMVLVRVFLAGVSSTLVSLSMTFAQDVAPRKYTTSIISWIFAGFNIASVIGVPFSMLITQLSSWRVAFGFIVIVSVILFILMIKHLPRKNPPPKKNMLQQLVLLTDKRIIMSVSAMILSASASYCFYTYLTPLLMEKMLLPKNLLSIAFVIFGIATIMSNLLSPLLSKVGGMRNLWYLFVIQAICSFVLTFTMDYLLYGAITVFILGLLMYALNTPTQMYFLEVSKKYYPGTSALAGSLVASAYNLGIALGSFAGSYSVGCLGLSSVGISGAIFAVLATLISYKLAKKIKREYSLVIKRALRIKSLTR